ncbi:uncharacterized protein BT62DRAFT_246680 [Guyanagaster necrorhizus]|uniref:Uncharacterized protein n=1 Tax=Guyanagaster necrorhizus TaxID=856835 RepID=A0A9P7VQ98_9AGAR|nr:uncharacterized protein BT62DRAFT_246680 [Guyanagaster necrorhizus MCA 3950]KAG7444495.1 hypothetical protein BT62DRAFT_246680 [Guyanagaster necrorhizus MCA 3950]
MSICRNHGYPCDCSDCIVLLMEEGASRRGRRYAHGGLCRARRRFTASFKSRNKEQYGIPPISQPYRFSLNIPQAQAFGALANIYMLQDTSVTSESISAQAILSLYAMIPELNSTSCTMSEDIAVGHDTLNSADFYISLASSLDVSAMQNICTMIAQFHVPTDDRYDLFLSVDNLAQDDACHKLCRAVYEEFAADAEEQPYDPSKRLDPDASFVIPNDGSDRWSKHRSTSPLTLQRNGVRPPRRLAERGDENNAASTSSKPDLEDEGNSSFIRGAENEGFDEADTGFYVEEDEMEEDMSFGFVLSEGSGISFTWVVMAIK